MKQEKIIGIFGSSLILISLFLPIVSAPFGISVTFLDLADGEYMLSIAIIGLIVSFFGVYKLLFVIAFAQLGFSVYWFYSIFYDGDNLGVQFNSSSNLFGISWAWPILIVGALLMIYSNFHKGNREDTITSNEGGSLISKPFKNLSKHRVDKNYRMGPLFVALTLIIIYILTVVFSSYF